MKKLVKFSAAQLKRTGYVELVWEDGRLAIGICYHVSDNTYSVMWYNEAEITDHKHNIRTLAETYKIASK